MLLLMQTQLGFTYPAKNGMFGKIGKVFLVYVQKHKQSCLANNVLERIGNWSGQPYSRCPLDNSVVLVYYVNRTVTQPF